MKIFMVGPAGTGKSTVGKILAKKINIKLIDLDEEFINKYGDINKLINSQGKEKYANLNSDLFYNILKDMPADYVFVLSSGFLVYEDERLTTKHKKTINKLGISVLIYPSKSLEISREIVVKRQLSRGFGYKKEREAHKFSTRFPIYKEFADIIIYSKENQDIVSDLILKNLKGL